MSGNTSRGLIAASKTRGWDSTQIPAGNGKPAQNLADFDVDQGNLPGRPVGQFVGKNPDPGGWPDSLTDPKINENIASSPPFNHPDAGRENANRRTRNANPTPGR